MTTTSQKHRQAKRLRAFRKVHSVMGAWLFLLFFIIAVSSILLAWKKHSGGWIQQTTQTGVSSDLKDWLPLDSLHNIAMKVYHDSIEAKAPIAFDRIEIRKENGVAKFLFNDRFIGIQLDGTTGALLLIEQRRSDIIESIHDGSILDWLFQTNTDVFKIIYSTVNGIALLLFTITGFWLWYGPKRLSKSFPVQLKERKRSRILHFFSKHQNPNPQK